MNNEKDLDDFEKNILIIMNNFSNFTERLIIKYCVQSPFYCPNYSETLNNIKREIIDAFRSSIIEIQSNNITSTSDVETIKKYVNSISIISKYNEEIS